MEEYFVQQLSNCFKVNFYNHVSKSQIPLLSLRRSPGKQMKTVHNREKKSLKRVISDQAFKKVELCVDNLQKNDLKSHNRKSEIEDYEYFINQKSQLSPSIQRKKQKVLQARATLKYHVKNRANSPIHPNLESRQFVKNQIIYYSPVKYQPINTMETPHKIPVQTITIERYYNSLQKNDFIEQRPQNIHFQQIANATPNRNQAYNDYGINKFNSDIIQSPCVKSQVKKTENDEVKVIKSPVKFQTKQSPVKKQRLSQETQDLSKIYDQIDLQPQIKKDLIKSLLSNRSQSQNDSHSFVKTGLTKTPSYQQSTINPLESKMIKTTNPYDSFKFDERYQTQSLLKALSSQTQSIRKVAFYERQKFRKIASIHSQQQSNESLDSVIIEKHSQHLNLKLKTLKSLL